MTEHQPGSREWAEAEARKGAKVRNKIWTPDVAWVTFNGEKFVLSNGNVMTYFPSGQYSAWSIVSPAPAQAPDLAARLSAVEELTDRLARAMWPMSYTQPPAPTFPLPDVQCSFTDALGKTLDFTTSRNPSDPAPGVMTDDEIVISAIELYYNGNPKDVAAEAIRLTRASDRAAREARTEAAVDVFLAANSFRAALAAYEGEG